MFENLKGWRTVVVNVVALAVAGLAVVGVGVSADESTAVVAGIMAIINIGLRLVTTTPVGSKEE